MTCNNLDVSSHSKFSFNEILYSIFIVAVEEDLTFGVGGESLISILFQSEGRQDIAKGEGDAKSRD